MVYNTTDFFDKLLAVAALAQPLLLIIQLILGDSGLITIEMASYLRVLMSAILILPALLVVFFRKFLLAILTFLGTIGLLVVSLFISFKNYDAIFSEGVRFLLLVNIPTLLAILAIKKQANFYKALKWIAYTVFMLGLVYYYLFVSQRLNTESASYNMSYGYLMLFSSLFFLMEGKWFHLLFAFIGLIIMSLMGSRGPTIALILFFVCKMALQPTKKVLIYFFSVVLILLFLTPTILELLYSYSENSRTLSMLLNGTYIRNDSGRFAIYSSMLDKINKSPFWGYGIFGDRQFINGFYSHNIFIEIWMNFGVVIGSLLIFSLFYFLIRTLRISIIQEKVLILFLTCYSLVELLVSSSYLISPSFFIFLGVIIKIHNKQKTKWNTNL